MLISETFEEQIESLLWLADRLRQANLTINLKKSLFCRKQVPYLGYIVSQNGLEADPTKISSVIDLPIPKNRRDVRSVISCLSWYRRFIPNLSQIISPLTELTKESKIDFKWTDEADKAFTEVKRLMTTPPILSPPGFSKPFYIHADASDIAAGMMLAQRDGEREKVICYHSIKFTDTQRRYTVTEKECLAVVKAIEKFKIYVDGTKFFVITDNHSLCFLLRMKNGNRRMLLWQLEFEVIHRKGKDNIVPDFLSRYVEEIGVVDDGDTEYDDFFQRIVDDPDQFPDFRIEGTNLYKHVRVIGEEGGFYFTWRLYLRKSQRVEIIKKVHESILCHLGYYKTMEYIKARYYWPKMATEVSKYVSECDICKASKPSNQTLRPLMGNPKPAHVPFHYLTMDFIQGLPRSRKGNTELLVVNDVFSKFVWCVFSKGRGFSRPKNIFCVCSSPISTYR